MEHIRPEVWKQDLPAFREKTAAFYAGELDKAAYKGFSGLYGSYAQRGGQASMLRLRMTAGRVTPEKLAFTAGAIRRYKVPRVHFTTCQTIQLHDLDGKTAGDIMEAALDAGIVTLGGGGDYPRNVMCSPLSGTEADEYFDVLPWAEAAGEYLMTFIKAEKMPRKLKVGFSSSPRNVTHATYRDLGFAARSDGKFDVYSAGGLGNNPRFGVRVAEAVEPAKILYYIKAMYLTFLAHGNYENRGKARTRYMQESCGGPESYRNAYREKLEEVFASGEDAAGYLNREIDGTTVGMGGSMTITELGLKESLSRHNTLYCHGFTEGDPADVQKMAAGAEIYLLSANGIAGDTSEIINIDGTGNRVSSSLYGHQKVYLVAGKNKVSPDFHSALHRVRNVVAPKNAQRLGRKTPCAAKADRCYDCDSPERICRGLTVLYRKMNRMDMEVILINQELGY